MADGKRRDSSKWALETELKRYFNGSAERCTVEHSKDCIHRGVLGGCTTLERDNCMDCSFYMRK